MSVLLYLLFLLNKASLRKKGREGGRKEGEREEGRRNGPEVVVNAFNLSAWEAEAGNLNQDQPALYSEF